MGRYLPFSALRKYDYKSNPFAPGAINSAAILDKYGNPAQVQGLQNLYQMLQTNGRVDPRLLAQAQASSARQTAQQGAEAQAGYASREFGNGGLASAMQQAIKNAGINRSANLTYQDLADSYGRQQQNLGLLGQLVTNPQQGYAGISTDLYNNYTNAMERQKAARVAGLAQGISSAAGGASGGGGK
jgi:hypothetical protein